MIEEKSEEEIYTPIPNKLQCNLCKKNNPDYMQHIAREEHTNLTNSQTEYFIDIDKIIDELNEAMLERLKHQPKEIAIKKLVLEQSTDFQLKNQKNSFSLNMDKTATKTTV